VAADARSAQLTKIQQQNRSLMSQLVGNHQMADCGRINTTQLECQLDRRPQPIVALTAAQLE
jgi:hypothetical protein